MYCKYYLLNFVTRLLDCISGRLLRGKRRLTEIRFTRRARTTFLSAKGEPGLTTDWGRTWSSSKTNNRITSTSFRSSLVSQYGRWLNKTRKEKPRADGGRRHREIRDRSEFRKWLQPDRSGMLIMTGVNNVNLTLIKWQC